MNSWLARIFTLLVAASVSGWLAADDGRRGPKGLAPLETVPGQAQWRQECGSCHMAYHPGLLPERSWQRIMGGLDKHFGENASLDAHAHKQVAEFLAAQSADRSPNRRSAKVNGSIAPTAAPLRISETAYFDRKHRQIAASTWQRKSIASKANCAACHGGADKGDFSESLVRIPK